MQRFAAGDRHGADALGGGEIPGYGQAAEHGRRHVVRMPFDGGGQIEDGRTVELALLREGGGRRDAGHDRLGGGAHAARLRDAVVRLEREAEPPQTEGAAGTAEGGDHQVGFVARQRPCALPLDDHVRVGVRRVVAQREGELVVVVQRQTDRVEPRPQVRAGGGDADMYTTCHRIHDVLLTRVGWAGSRIDGETRIGRSAPRCRIVAPACGRRGDRAAGYSTRRMEGSPVTKSSWQTASTVSRSVTSSVRWVTRRSCWSSPE